MDNEGKAMLAGLIIGLGFCFPTCGTAYQFGEKNMQETLVEQGHAEYYLDESHEKQWRMKGE